MSTLPEDLLGSPVTSAVKPAVPPGAKTLFADGTGDSSEGGSSSPAVTKAFGSPHPATSPLADIPAKQLDFDAGASAADTVSQLPPSFHAHTPVVPATPATPVLATPVSRMPAAADSHSAESALAVDYNQFVKETLLWQNRLRSAVYLVGGLLAILAVRRALMSSITIVTGICWLLLAQLALNFLRHFVSPSLQARCKWYDSMWTHGAISTFSRAVKGLAAVHDANMEGAEPRKTLLIGLGLWALSLAGRQLSATGLALGLWVAAFTLPKAYLTFQAKIDKAVGEVVTQVMDKYTGLDSKVKAGITVVPILVAGYALSPADLAVAVFLLSVYGRCWLSAKEVDAINQRVLPYTATASKLTATVSRIVGNAAVKYELTPTPAKAKRA